MGPGAHSGDTQRPHGGSSHCPSPRCALTFLCLPPARCPPSFPTPQKIQGDPRGTDVGGSKGQGILTGSTLGRHTCAEYAHTCTHTHICMPAHRQGLGALYSRLVYSLSFCLVLASSAQSGPWKSGSLEVKHQHEPPRSMALNLLDLFLENLLKPDAWVVWGGD